MPPTATTSVPPRLPMTGDDQWNLAPPSVAVNRGLPSAREAAAGAAGARVRAAAPVAVARAAARRRRRRMRGFLLVGPTVPGPDPEMHRRESAKTLGARRGSAG